MNEDLTTGSEEAASEEIPLLESGVTPAPGVAAPRSFRSRGRAPGGRKFGGERRGIIVVTLVGVTLLALLAYHFWPLVNLRRLLEKTVATYQTAQSLQVEGKFVMDINMGGIKAQEELPFKVEYQQPNLLLVEYGQGGLPGAKVVSDGKYLWMEMSMLNAAARAPAPADMKQFGSGGVLGGLGGASPLGSMANLSHTKFDPASLIKSVRPGYDHGDPWLRELKKPSGTVALTVVPKDMPPVTLWIDRHSGQLRMAAMNMDMKQMTQKMPPEARQGMPQGGPATGMAQMLENAQMKVVLDISKTAVNEPVPTSDFAYQPAPGINVAEAASADGLNEALMRAMGESVRDLGSLSASGMATAPPAPVQ